MKYRKNCLLCNSPLPDAPCNSVPIIDYISEEEFNLVKCGNCGLIYTNPYPEMNEDFHKYYPDNNYYILDKEENFNIVIKALFYISTYLKIKDVLKLKKTGKILDIGCGQGQFLHMLNDRGWDCVGIERSVKLKEYVSKKYNIPVMDADMKKWEFKNQEFDVINIYHVIEHIEEPETLLKKVREIIKDDGILIMGLPNIASFQSGVFSNKWFHLDLPRHLLHYSHETITVLLNKCGFEVISNKGFSFEHDTYGQLQSILNMFMPSNYFYNLLRNVNINNKYFSLLYSIPSFLFGGLLFVPLLIIEYILSYFNYNGTMKIYSKPV